MAGHLQDDSESNHLDESILSQIISERTHSHRLGSESHYDDDDQDDEEVGKQQCASVKEKSPKETKVVKAQALQVTLDPILVKTKAYTGAAVETKVAAQEITKDSQRSMTGQRAGAFFCVPDKEEKSKPPTPLPTTRASDDAESLSPIPAPIPTQLTRRDNLSPTLGQGAGAYSSTPGEGYNRRTPARLDSRSVASDTATDFSEELDLEQGQAASEPPPHPLPIAAQVVEDHKDLAVASVVDHKDDNKREVHKNRIIGGCFVLVLVLVGVIVAFVTTLGKQGNAAPPNQPTVASINITTNDTLTEPQQAELTTLQEIAARGYVRCSMYATSLGFSNISLEDGTATGLNWDLCRAVAAVVLDDPNAVQAVPATAATRFVKLQDREVDLIGVATHNMGRDTLEDHVLKGSTFSVPYAYLGLSFAGIPTYVDCAESLEVFTNDLCRDMVICVRQGTTYENRLDKLFPGPEKRLTHSHSEMFQALERGECNVVADGSSALSESQARESGYTGNYKLGERLFSKETLALTTRDDDPEWSNLVNLVMNSLITAHAYNITQASAASNEYPAVLEDIADKAFQPAVIKSVAAVGNIRELYERNLLGVVPLSGINSLNDGSNGLLMSFPFGKLETQGTIKAGGAIESIQSRGVLRCGVTKKPGFAELAEDSETWTGLDVDYCRFVAAALFPSAGSMAVEFVMLPSPQERFEQLAQGEVDLLAGERVSLLNGFQEPTTGMGYSFSPPYFYDNDGSSNSYALATRQDDPQFSDLVYWLVMASFYAEEEGISHDAAHEMPIVRLFGEGLKGIFIDSIYEVGNYGDMYNRNLEALIPRAGRNNLNLEMGPQQFAIPFV